MLKIRSEDSPFIVFSNLQHETPRFVVFSVDPTNPSAEKLVSDHLVSIETEDDLVWFFSGEEISEIGVFDRAQRIQIRVNSTVQLILLQVIVELRDFVELVNVKPIDDLLLPFLHHVNQTSFEQNNSD